MPKTTQYAWASFPAEPTVLGLLGPPHPPSPYGGGNVFFPCPLSSLPALGCWMHSSQPPLILEEKGDATSSDQAGAPVGQPVQLMQEGMYVKRKASVYVQSK